MQYNVNNILYKTNIIHHIQASKKGDLASMYELGKYYFYGFGVDKNLHKSFEWFKHAAKNGSVEGIRQLGICYREGRGVPQNYAKAVNAFIDASNQGDGFSMYELGVYYQDGLGVLKDFNEAFKWFERASNSGYSKALLTLGIYYEQGLGNIPQNFDRAICLYNKADKEGITEANYWLGGIYSKYDKIENLPRGIHCYFEAAANGSYEISIAAMTKLRELYEKKHNKVIQTHIQKKFNELQNCDNKTGSDIYVLGLCLEYGIGTLQDSNEAILLYWEASKKGYEKALLKFHHLEILVESEGINLWYQGIKYLYGQNHLDDDKYLEDHKLAADYFHEAAKKGNLDAMYKLATLYEIGDGVIKNDEIALKWYTEAASRGSVDALQRLREI